MLAGRVGGKKTSLSSMFEAVGAYTAGKIDEHQLTVCEENTCPVPLTEAIVTSVPARRRISTTNSPSHSSSPSAIKTTALLITFSLSVRNSKK